MNSIYFDNKDNEWSEIVWHLTSIIKTRNKKNAVNVIKLSFMTLVAFDTWKIIKPFRIASEKFYCLFVQYLYR